MSKLMTVTCDICGTTETYNPRMFHSPIYQVFREDLDICAECFDRLKFKAKETDNEPKHDQNELFPVIEEKYRKFEIYSGDSESVFSDIASAYENNPEISYLDMLIQTGLVKEDWPFPEEWNSVGWRKMPVCKFMDDPRTCKTFVILSEPNKFVK